MPTGVTQEAIRARYEEVLKRNLNLDMTRGKPSTEQLDLSNGLMGVVGPESFRAEGQTDCRNYGGVDGLPETKRLFAEILGVETSEVLIGDNASLSLMYDVVAQAMLRGVPGGERPWSQEEKVRFLCPAPGYDRHFSVCEHLGIEMVTVAMTDDGPDMGVVRDLAKTDPSVRGMFCVPRYSNPTGITYSAETVEGLAGMETAAPDFRIIWDNAYSVHHLYPDPEPLANLLEICKEKGHPERALMFCSTSKITMAGAGIGAVGASQANIDDVLSWRSMKTIGPDKLNQLRHSRFLPDLAAVEAHMQRHAESLRPKFETVDSVLEEELGGLGVATWTRPRGGYFISLDTPDGCAKEVVAMSAAAGVKLTPAGATFPYRNDPNDRNIRISPSFPPVADLEQATRVLALSLLLVAFEKGVL